MLGVNTKHKRECNMELIDAPEFQIILQLLSPDYIWSAAERYGKGDAIRGARKAYIETRKLIRLLVNQARERERKEQGLDRLPRDLEFALLLRSLGWPVYGSIKKLIPVSDEGWRRLANAFWPNGTPIPGGLTIPVKDAKFTDVYEAAIIATSRMLEEHPEFNRAVLDERVWQRSDNLVMVHFEIRTGLMSMVMDASKRDREWVNKKLRKGLKTAVKFSRTEMARYSTQLLIEWARAGFIGSPAGAMISGCPGVQYGWGALVPCNGIPLVVCVNEPIDGKVFLGISPDHRAFDGKQVPYIHGFLYEHIQEILDDYGNTPF